ncbi:GntR family transcriptional regulator [Dactylosporangium sp. CA-233914]|uniref:GntR family transcriptional regulator n=1 Tax=Dactylosporangium sp. CA-233914 TaxID=3239934 RepID=UPI003D8DEE7B
MRERVYETILQDIIAGRLAPGDRITERVLARSLGISTTPVKEALRRLENEGYVSAVPRTGVVVKETALTSVGDVVVARAWLEGLAARLVAERFAGGGLPAGQRAELAEVVGEMGRAPAEAGLDLELVVTINARFHDLIRTMSGNRLIGQFVGVLLGVDSALRRHLLTDEAELRRGLAEHLAVYEAVCAGDPDRAETRMREHILRSASRVVATTRQEATP